MTSSTSVTKKNVLDSSREYNLLLVTSVSRAVVTAAIKEQIGKAVAPGCSPADILGVLQVTVTRAESAE